MVDKQDFKKEEIDIEFKISRKRKLLDGSEEDLQCYVSNRNGDVP